MTSTQTTTIQITDPKLGTFVVPYAPLAERLPLFLLDDEAPLPDCIEAQDEGRYKAMLAATATVVQLEKILTDVHSGQVQQPKSAQRTMLRNRLAETNPTPTLKEFAETYAKAFIDVEWYMNLYDTPTSSKKAMANTMSVIKLGHAPAIAAAMSGYAWVRKHNSPDEIAGALADAFEAELAE